MIAQLFGLTDEILPALHVSDVQRPTCPFLYILPFSRAPSPHLLLLQVILGCSARIFPDEWRERAGPVLDFFSSSVATLVCSVVSTPQMVITDRESGPATVAFSHSRAFLVCALGRVFVSITKARSIPHRQKLSLSLSCARAVWCAWHALECNLLRATTACALLSQTYILLCTFANLCVVLL